MLVKRIKKRGREVFYFSSCFIGDDRFFFYFVEVKERVRGTKWNGRRNYQYSSIVAS